MFNKIIIAILSVVLIFTITISNKKPIFYGYADTFEVYLLEDSSLAKIVYSDRSDFLFLKKISGESFKVNGKNFNFTEFLSNMGADIVFTEEIESGISFYAFSNKIKYRKEVNEKMINLQIFIPNDIENSLITVGTPIIFGSF